MSPIMEEDSTTDSHEFEVSEFRAYPDESAPREKCVEVQVIMKVAAVGLLLLVLIDVFDFIL